MAIDNYDLRALLEITGENSGGCDYTGWDVLILLGYSCAGVTAHPWFDATTQEAALALCSQDVRRVFEDMLAKGETVRPNTALPERGRSDVFPRPLPIGLRRGHK